MRLSLTHEGIVYTYQVKKEITTLGRDPGCDIALPTGTVSRFHAQLRREGDDLVLKDLGSRNGVFVNGARVREARLRSGDEIRLGKIAVRFQKEEPPAVPAGFSRREPEPPELEGTLKVGSPAPGGDNPTPVDLAFSPQDLEGAAPPEAPRVSPSGVRPPASAGLRVWLGEHWKPLAIAFVILDAALLGGYFWVKGRRAPPPSAPVSDKDRQQALEDAAVLMERARVALPRDAVEAKRLWIQARAQLSRLKDQGQDRVTSRLGAILDVWEPVVPSYDNFPWDSFKRILEILDNLEQDRKAPARVQDIARGWADWLKYETLARENLLKIDPLMAPEADLAQWLEAHGRLLKADPKSLTWPVYERRLPDLKRRIGEAYVAQARKAFAKGHWEEAQGALEEASRWGSDLAGALAAEVAGEQAAEADLAAARQALEGGDDAEAEARVRRIGERSRFAPEAQPILAEISRRKARREILQCFDSGDAAEALKRLFHGPIDDPALVQLVRKVDAAWKAAEEAERKLDFDEAILKAGEILNLLSDAAFEGNVYRQKAQGMREAWQEPAVRAKRLYDEGCTREAAGDIPGAFSWWNRARQADPEGNWARRERETYDLRARRLLNDAIQSESSGDKAAARKLLDQLLLIAEPGSYAEEQARKRLAKLQ